MKTQTNHTKLNLTAVIRKIISSWVVVAVCAILGLILSFAVLVPGRNAKAQLYREAAAVSAAERTEIWKNSLTADECAYVDNAMEIKKLIRETEAYLENSVVMGVDPYNVPTLMQYYSVQSLNGAPRNVAQEYVNYVNNGKVMNLLGEKLGWDISSGNYSEMFTAAVVDNNTFSVTVLCPSSASAEDIQAGLTDVVTDLIGDAENALSDTISVEKKDSVFSVKANTTLANNLNTVQYRMTSYGNQMNSIINAVALKPAQNNYFWALAGELDGVDYSDKYMDTPETSVSAPRSAAFYYAIGIAGGLILGIGIIFLQILFGETLLSAEELYTVFGLPMAASIRKSKKHFESSTASAASRLAAMCKAAGIGSVIIAGSALQQKGGPGKKKNSTSDAAAKLAEYLKKDGIEASVMGAWNETPADEICACGNVILLEACSQSTYKDIESEIVTITGCKLNLIAAAAVE